MTNTTKQKGDDQMKTAKLENLKEHEITAMYNYLAYGISLCKKLHKVLNKYGYDSDDLTAAIHKLKG